MLLGLLALATGVNSPAVSLAGSGVELWRLDEPDDANREWYKKLVEKLGKRVSFDFHDTPVQDVLAFLANLTGVPLSYDPAAFEQGGPGIMLKVTEMPLGDALREVLHLAGLDFRISSETILITTPDRVIRQARHNRAALAWAGKDETGKPAQMSIRGVLLSAPSGVGDRLLRKLLGRTKGQPKPNVAPTLTREAVQELMQLPQSVMAGFASVNRQMVRNSSGEIRLVGAPQAAADGDVVSVKMSVTFPRNPHMAGRTKVETGTGPEGPKARTPRVRSPNLETTVALRNGQWSLVVAPGERNNASVHAVILCATVVKMDRQPKKEVPQQD